jgi:hypothetical protein
MRILAKIYPICSLSAGQWQALACLRLTSFHTYNPKIVGKSFICFAISLLPDFKLFSGICGPCDVPRL